jgi:hypothetical protein
MKKLSFLWAFLIFSASFVLSFAVSVSALNFNGNQVFDTQLNPAVLQANIDSDLQDEDEPASESAVTATPVQETKPDLTQKSEETVEPLVRLLNAQNPGSVLVNPIKHAIRASVASGVPANTIVLLLMIPAVTALIAAARHLIGIRGFGIFLPAVLSVVFVAIGPVVGLALFLVIVVVSTIMRIVMRRTKIKLQYLPRMSMVMLFSVLGVLGVLFLAPVIRTPYITNVSIFPVLILVLLAEEFSKVQLGKSVKTAINLTTETLILALASYIFLTLKPAQEYALLHPENFILIIFVVDYLLGKYVGLRFVEFWRFRKLISG